MVVALMGPLGNSIKFTCVSFVFDIERPKKVVYYASPKDSNGMVRCV